MEKEIAIDNIIDTYKCLITLCYAMPEMSLGKAFDSNSIGKIKKEYNWLKNLNNTNKGEMNRR